jgi:hypothetical protein
MFWVPLISQENLHENHVFVLFLFLAINIITVKTMWISEVEVTLLKFCLLFKQYAVYVIALPLLFVQWNSTRGILYWNLYWKHLNSVQTFFSLLFLSILMLSSCLCLCVFLFLHVSAIITKPAESFLWWGEKLAFQCRHSDWSEKQTSSPSLSETEYLLCWMST